MGGLRDQARQHRKTVTAGVIFGIAIGLCAGAAVAFFYKSPPSASPLRSPLSSTQASAPPLLAASDCADTGINAAEAEKAFSLRVESEGVTLNRALEEKLAVGTTRTYAQWQEWLGDGALRQSQINIRFVGDARRFREIYGKPNGEAWTTTGFYRMRSNEALILYTPAYRGSALGNAFHEISHLITARHLGATPPWLNEGLAEHYESLEVKGSNARFTSNADHLRLLQRRGAVSVDTLTTLSQQEWMGEDAERRYASAWALIAFLLETPAGAETLKGTVLTAYAGRCDSRRDLRVTLEDYPGGTASLQEDWQAWLSRRYTRLPHTREITADGSL
ncbi:DUF1570 domain-containing protein [Congregibacter litoralis]|uniref:Peptidase MA superfamily n=1 Tax=Congregibacter litoralis KT71 TaxID=314285 RepID=A4A503_9GAMM|nr:DUF1570 domain-containing protein [Congregibacter litoralis]EAQ98874.1 Peptidase MA superfamily [Congregibacter litoralis KT71]